MDNFTKEDLKTGDELIYRGKECYRVLKDNKIFNKRGEQISCLGNYEKDLTNRIASRALDIIAVIRNGEKIMITPVEYVDPVITKETALTTKLILEQMCEYSENENIHGKNNVHLSKTVDDMLKECERLLKPDFDSLDIYAIQHDYDGTYLQDGGAYLGTEVACLSDVYITEEERLEAIDKVNKFRALGLSVSFNKIDITKSGYYDELKRSYYSE